MRLQTETAKIAHLLRRFGLGASEAEMLYYGPLGLKGTINKLLDTSGDDGFGIPIERFAQAKNNINLRGAQAWWVSRMLITQKPLQEKLTLFWHDHFAASAQKVDSAVPMLAQNETLRQNALGRFEDLLFAVSKDPAMIYWLDNQLNVSGKPNENFAREVMELFTLGIGHYTERDIQEAARAFTGWGYGRPGKNRQVVSEQRVPRGGVVFNFDAGKHDNGVKTVLGNTGPFNGDDICGILAGHPQTARAITIKMWEFFAYEKPEDALVERLATTYRKNGLRTSVLVRAIMESPEFYSDRAARRLYKNPVDFCVSTLRQLGVGTLLKEQLSQESAEGPGRAATVPAAVSSAMKAMGMELFVPPDVAGWDWGSAWISTATMVERMKWADRLFGVAGGRTFRYPIQSLVTPGMSAEGFARMMCSLLDAELPEAKVRALAEAAQKAAGGKLEANATKAATSVARLIFSTPEYQFS